MRSLTQYFKVQKTSRDPRIRIPENYHMQETEHATPLKVESPDPIDFLSQLTEVSSYRKILDDDTHPSSMDYFSRPFPSDNQPARCPIALPKGDCFREVPDIDWDRSVFES